MDILASDLHIQGFGPKAAAMTCSANRSAAETALHKFELDFIALGMHPLKKLVYAYYAVKKNYNVFAEISVPSLRSRILSQNSEKGVLFSINESSTITSKFYKFNQEDSIFIFFTDDVLWQRPFYGIVNLVVGIGELGYGIIISPFDKGNTIVKGLQGVFFSGPEIIFFNIRKGTFLYELDGQWKDSNDDNFNN